MPPEAEHARAADSKPEGFTLIEVLIALIIFAIAFGALAGIFQTSLRQAGLSEDLQNATLLAETQLARIGRDVALRPGRTEGASPDGLNWQAEISLARPVDEDSGLALYRIRIEAGAEGASSRRVELQTFRIGAGR